LYYVSPERRLVSVDIHESASDVSLGSAAELFTFSPEVAGYDVSPDGKRFLVLVPEETGGTKRELTIFLDWRQVLSRR
jgi:hypothetical protein